MSRSGIIAASIYFPKCYVDQSQFEAYCNVSPGKYTKGLGQKCMAVCGDGEDSVSLALNATEQLITDYNVDTNTIRRLEVGTESLIDKSKSIKSHLMRLFPTNPYLAGCDVYNACFGATQAVFNAVQWVDSTFYEPGSFAIVVATDIAVYADGPARCTGGAGAVALLIGPDAPIAIVPHLASFYCEDNYDFYKPLCRLPTEYPVVDGPLSVQCYNSCLMKCYEAFKHTYKRLTNQNFNILDTKCNIAVCNFHSPYSRLVEKSVMALLQHDETGDKRLMNGSLAAHIGDWCEPGLSFSRRLGNLYTASVWASVISTLAVKGDTDLHGKNMMMYSYGSGSIASMFVFNVNLPGDGGVESLLVRNCRKYVSELSERVKVSPDVFVEMLHARENMTAAFCSNEVKVAKNGFQPACCAKCCVFGSASTEDGRSRWHLVEVDSQMRRHYRKSKYVDIVQDNNAPGAICFCESPSIQNGHI